MALPPAKFLVAHAVLGFRDALSREPSETETFSAALRKEFPNLLGRPLLPPEAPVQAPHLTLASTSSQLAVSALQADFEVRFYGDYLQDLTKSLEYVENKLLAIFQGATAIDAVPTMIGLIGTFHFSLGIEAPSAAAEHILATHLNVDVDPAVVQDALARIAVKVRDTYFVTMTLSNYESRLFERPLMPGIQIRVRPWEGQVNDLGLELTLDINNVLEGRAMGRDPVVTEDGIRAVIRMLREVAHTAGPAFADTGAVDVDSLTASSSV